MGNNVHHDASFRTSAVAIGYGLIGWTAFVCTDTLSKWLALEGYGVSQIIATSSFISMVLNGIWLLSRYGAGAFISPYLKWHIIRSASVAGTAFCVVSALRYIPLADFYGIIFLSPLVLCLMAYFFLGETIGIHRILAVIAGFSGVIVMAAPQYNDLNAGIFFALIAVICIALNGLTVRKMRGETVLPLFALYPSLLNILVHTPLMLLNGVDLVAAGDIPLFLAFGPCLLIGLVFYSLAFKKIHETAILAPFQYTQMIWGILFGYLLFGDVPSWATLGGSGIIILAGLYALWREHVAHKQRLSAA